MRLNDAESTGQAARVRLTTRRLATISLVLGAALGAGVSNAIAASTNSANAYYTVYGINYLNWEGLSTYSNPSAQSGAYAETTNGANVAAGWIGASTDLDTSNGSLCARSGWSYNTQATNFYGNYVANFCGAAYYYGIGATQGYNGSGYSGYYTNQTANLWAG